MLRLETAGKDKTGKWRRLSRKMCKDEDSDYMANLRFWLYTFAVDVNHSHLQEAPSIKWNFSKVAVVYVWIPRRQSGNIEE